MSNVQLVTNEETRETEVQEVCDNAGHGAYRPAATVQGEYMTQFGLVMVNLCDGCNQRLEPTAEPASEPERDPPDED